MNLVIDVSVLQGAIKRERASFSCLKEVEGNNSHRVAYNTEWTKQWRDEMRKYDFHGFETLRRYLNTWFIKAINPNEKGVPSGPAAARKCQAMRTEYTKLVPPELYNVIKKKFYVIEMAISPFAAKIIIFREDDNRELCAFTFFQKHAASIAHAELHKIEWKPTSKETAEWIRDAD